MTDSGYVLLTTTPTSFDAEWIVGALKGVDIQAMTTGDGPADEFTMAQRVTGGGGVEVFVPEAELADARAVLAEIRGDGEPGSHDSDSGESARPDDAESSPRSASTRPLWVAIGVLSVALAWALWKWHEAPPATVESPVFGGAWEGAAWVERWRENGEIHHKSWDADRDGMIEEVQSYDQRGRLYQAYYDRDQDGVFEEWYSETGGLRTRYFDENQNLVTERFEIEHPKGVVERWLDGDEDGLFERREFVQQGTGELLQAEEDRGLGDGFVRVR